MRIIERRQFILDDKAADSRTLLVQPQFSEGSKISETGYSALHRRLKSCRRQIETDQCGTSFRQDLNRLSSLNSSALKALCLELTASKAASRSADSAPWIKSNHGHCHKPSAVKDNSIHVRNGNTLRQIAVCYLTKQPHLFKTHKYQTIPAL